MKITLREAVQKITAMDNAEIYGKKTFYELLTSICDNRWIAIVYSNKVKHVTLQNRDSAKKFINDNKRKIYEISEEDFVDDGQQIVVMIDIEQDEKYDNPNIVVEKKDNEHFYIKMFVNKEQRFYLITGMESAIFQFEHKNEINFSSSLPLIKGKSLYNCRPDDDPKWNELIDWD